jgi:hypothetical protein
MSKKTNSVKVSISVRELVGQKYDLILRGIQIALNDLNANVVVSGSKMKKGRYDFTVADKVPVPKAEDILRVFLLAFCENAAEIGCPEREVDMWFRELSKSGQRKACGKLLEIMDRKRKG